MSSPAVDAFIDAATVPRDASHTSGTLEQAEAIRAAHPDVQGESICAAAILGDAVTVRRLALLRRAMSPA